MGIHYDDNDDVKLKSLDGPVAYGSISVSTSAVEAKVGASALAGRAILIIQPKANNIYLGYDNSVTTSNGIQLFKNQTIIVEFTDDVSVYLIAQSGTNDVRIQEIGQSS